jgi:hypothetical protein
MSAANIVLVNESTVLTDAQVQAVVPALQTQASRDFAPAWLQDASLAFQGAKGGPVAAGAWQIAVLDDSDQAGALGYHDLTPDGLPLSKIFAKSDLQYGTSWTVTLSHELLEMLADPWINRCAQFGDDFLALEVCDAVEDDSLGYQINGTLVSDFVLPAWFTPGSSGPWDFRSLLAAAGQLLSGGYIGMYVPGQGWTQKTQDRMAFAKRAPVGSRRERRANRAHWHRSRKGAQ